MYTSEVEQALMRAELLMHLNQAIAALPDDERRMIRMCFLQHIPVIEIAKAFGVDRITVWRRTQKALRDIRTTLKRRGWTKIRVAQILAT